MLNAVAEEIFERLARLEAAVGITFEPKGVKLRKLKPKRKRRKS